MNFNLYFENVENLVFPSMGDQPKIKRTLKRSEQLEEEKKLVSENFFEFRAEMKQIDRFDQFLPKLSNFFSPTLIEQFFCQDEKKALKLKKMAIMLPHAPSLTRLIKNNKNFFNQKQF